MANLEKELKDLGVIDEMSAYDNFDDFYKNFLTYKDDMFKMYGEVVKDLSKIYSKEQLLYVWNKHNQ